MKMMDFSKLILFRCSELKKQGKIKRNLSCLELCKVMYLIHREYLRMTGNNFYPGGEVICYHRHEKFSCIMNGNVYKFYSRWGADDIDWYLGNEGITFDELCEIFKVKYKKPMKMVMDKYLIMSYLEISNLQSSSVVFKSGMAEITESDMRIDIYRAYIYGRERNVYGN